LGAAQTADGRPPDALVSFRKATELDPADMKAWEWCSALEAATGNRDAAVECLAQAERDAPRTADAVTGLGHAYRRIELPGEAVAHYRQAVQLSPDHCPARLGIALALYGSDDYPGGVAALEQALQVCRDRNWEEGVAVCLNDINAYLLQNASLPELRGLVEHQAQLVGDSGYEKQFVEGVTGALTEVLSQHDQVPLDRLRAISDGPVADLAEREEFSVVCRLFNTAVRYLDSEDVRVLLELPLEERRRVEELLGLRSN